ncbi:MAG: type I restriction enzyme HsdR N-terminal domain-containing protein, partial [Ruminococcus sp.]|nr:type I restriction enzyme HsdR N-terminal domain-containing protein [Ruminococcus sp.]
MNIQKALIPKIYKRNGKECFLDPIRKKLIQITPEEIVRQKVISYLINEMNVPESMISVEEHLSHY